MMEIRLLDTPAKVSPYWRNTGVDLYSHQSIAYFLRDYMCGSNSGVETMRENGYISDRAVYQSGFSDWRINKHNLLYKLKQLVKKLAVLAPSEKIDTVNHCAVFLNVYKPYPNRKSEIDNVMAKSGIHSKIEIWPINSDGIVTSKYPIWGIVPKGPITKVSEIWTFNTRGGELIEQTTWWGVKNFFGVPRK